MGAAKPPVVEDRFLADALECDIGAAGWWGCFHYAAHSSFLCDKA
jgi:hypothetical protein